MAEKEVKTPEVAFEEKVQKEGLISAVYGLGKDIIDAIKKPIVISSLKDQVREAYRSAEIKKEELKAEEFNYVNDLINNSSGKVQLDFDFLIKTENEIKKYETSQLVLKALNKKFFAKELKTNFSEED